MEGCSLPRVKDRFCQLLFLSIFLIPVCFLSTPGITATPPSPPLNFRAVGFNGGAEVNLAWDPNIEPDLAGYKLHWGTRTGPPYEHVVEMGNVTSCGLSNLTPGTYYLAVTAYNVSYLESFYSNEIRILVKVHNLPSLPLLLGD